MKTLLRKTTILLSAVLLLSCVEPVSTPGKKDITANPMVTLLIDGAKKSADPAALISSSFTSEHFLLGYMSEQNDIQFTVSAFMAELKPGTYQVYECRSASECDDATPDHNQLAMFAPFPKDPMPATNLSRTAYYSPRLALQPLTLTISSVTDEQQAGMPYTTKRVKGQFSGTLAYVEQEAGGTGWKIVGKPSKVEGDFDVFCGMR